MATQLPLVGFIGMGAMGGPMVRSLCRYGYPVLGYDTLPERIAEAVTSGATAAQNSLEVVRRAEVVLTSLPCSEVFVNVAESVLLPEAREGQTFIDMGTVAPPETRRLAKLFKERGAVLIDCPCSGGVHGAREGRLRLFAGGPREAVERCRPILEAIGGTEHLHYCGPSGNGQVVKGVNQLAMGLLWAGVLEPLALAAHAGVELGTVVDAVGEKDDGGEAWRHHFHTIAQKVLEGRGEEVTVKFRELPYYLREAAEAGYELPLTRALHAFCDRGERIAVHDGWLSPSFWAELMRDSDAPS